MECISLPAAYCKKRKHLTLQCHTSALYGSLILDILLVAVVNAFKYTVNLKTVLPGE
jgi:hypothetical protein